MSKREQHAEAARLRRAARYYERNWTGGGVDGTYYPCFTVRMFDPHYGRWDSTTGLAGRFIMAVCPGETAPQSGSDASDRFLDRVDLYTPEGRDHSILAICFAAAMAETGDL